MWFGIEDPGHMLARGSSLYSSGFDSLWERWERVDGSPALLNTRACRNNGRTGPAFRRVSHIKPGQEVGRLRFISGAVTESRPERDSHTLPSCCGYPSPRYWATPPRYPHGAWTTVRKTDQGSTGYVVDFRYDALPTDPVATKVYLNGLLQISDRLHSSQSQYNRFTPEQLTADKFMVFPPITYEMDYDAASRNSQAHNDNLSQNAHSRITMKEIDTTTLAQVKTKTATSPSRPCSRTCSYSPLLARRPPRPCDSIAGLRTSP